MVCFVIVFRDFFFRVYDFVKKYCEEVKMFDDDVKNIKLLWKDQDVDYIEDFDDLQWINNILFGGKFKYIFFFYYW